MKKKKRRLMRRKRRARVRFQERKRERVKNEGLLDDPSLFSDKVRQMALSDWILFLLGICAFLLLPYTFLFSFLCIVLSLNLMGSLWEYNKLHYFFLFVFFLFFCFFLLSLLRFLSSFFCFCSSFFFSLLFFFFF